MDTIKFRFSGTSPLMMHSDRGANPLDPEVQKHKELTSNKQKSISDYKEVAWSEYRLSIYHNEADGPFIPAQNIDKALVEAATKNKLGKNFKSSVQVIDTQIPLLYKGPRTIQGLYDDGSFVDIRTVKVNMVRIVRVRPLFREWSLEFSVAFDDTIVNRSAIVLAAEIAGSRIGLGDYRPRYGRFTTEVL